MSSERHAVARVEKTKEKEKEDLPQTITYGNYKEGENSDTITFKLKLGLFELICIVTVPEKGTIQSPVYVKYRVCRE